MLWPQGLDSDWGQGIRPVSGDRCFEKIWPVSRGEFDRFLGNVSVSRQLLALD